MFQHSTFLRHQVTALRLARQHAQPLSSDKHSSELAPQSYSTSGVDTASLPSSDVQTEFISGNLFSEVLISTPVPPHIRLPEYYTTEHSRPPKNFADYPIRVDGTAIHEPKIDPRFRILTERFFTTNDSLSNKREETELKRLQTSNLERKFEVIVKFQGVIPHPLFRVSKLEHKFVPALFEVTHIEFEKDPQLPNLPYGRIIFYNPYSDHFVTFTKGFLCIQDNQILNLGLMKLSRSKTY